MDGESLAQTNLQLLNQLRRQGYPDVALLRIKDAYFFVTELFPGSFRASGKPFIAHLVGTASALAAIHAPIPVVVAGLLHAAYAAGEFGAGWRGISPTKAAMVRRAAGDEVEALVARYTRWPWTAGTVARVRADLAAKELVDHDVVLMRLANELDDMLDLSVLYCADADTHLGAMRTQVALLTAIARDLGYPDLARRLDRAWEAMLTAEVPPNLRTARTGAYLVAPRRWREWVAARLRHFLGD